MHETGTDYMGVFQFLKKFEGFEDSRQQVSAFMYMNSPDPLASMGVRSFNYPFRPWRGGEPKGTMARWASTDSLSEISYLECVWCFAGYDLNQFNHFHFGFPLQKGTSLQ